SCKVSGTSKHGDIAANAARQETSASQVSPARSITVLVPGKIDTSVMASRISRISARLKLSSYSRPVWENSTVIAHPRDAGQRASDSDNREAKSVAGLF